MKFLFSLIMLFSLVNSASAQTLEYKKGHFLFENNKYPISDIDKALVLNDDQQYMVQKIQSMHHARKTWTALTMISVAATGIGITTGLHSSNSESGIVSATGQILSALLVLVSAPTALVSITGLTISSIKRKKRINKFVDHYNSNSNINSTIELGLSTTSSGIGLVLTF